VRIREDAHGLWRVGLLGVPSPRYSYPPSYTDSQSYFCLAGVRQTSTDLELLSGAYSSQLRNRFYENRAVIDWFRLLLGCLGRAGRHRRTGRESLCPQPDSCSL